jgi:hypothetical protein
MEINDQQKLNIASLIEPMGVSPLFFVARLSVDLSTIPNQILPCLDKINLIVDGVNNCFNTEHSVWIVRTLCNTLSNGLVVSNASVPAMNYIHATSLLPFTNVCIDCDEPLSHYASKAIRILCKKTVKDGLSIIAICTRCSLRYGHSSVESMNQYTVPHDFTLSLLYSHTTISKRFQTHWVLWLLIHFDLMLGNSCIVSIPSLLNRTVIDDHFEKSSGWWYHLFTVLWSRHHVDNMAVFPASDAIQRFALEPWSPTVIEKTGRLVCQFREMVDNTIVEMGPIETGCLLAPLRRTEKSPNGNCWYDIIY